MMNGALRFGMVMIAAAAALLQPVLSLAGDADSDLRQAAKQHRGGETAAALLIWRRWADQGNVDAAYNLAVVHQHGDGVAINPVEAMKWYRIAAERGDHVSQYQLGLMYMNGEGVPVDKEAAHRWFTGHRAHHAHHDHTPQMVAWRRQAAALIQERDLRESLAASRANADQVLADLRRRAGMDAAPALAEASIGQTANRRQ